MMRNKEIENMERPWGAYFILDKNPLYKLKRIEVNINSRLSYQYHEKRSETWVVIDGGGIVTIDGKTKEIGKGDVIIIPKKSKHRVENTSDKKLIFIEVQTGTYFGEDDIVRIEDDYNRV